ncbi:MAG: MFS transporter [Planctomycetes bacterium]|nr:MFS transporter [Planctomycetota bacterium]
MPSLLARWCALLTAFAGLLFAGIQLGLMPIASLSVSRSLMGEAFTEAAASQWFARYTASLMLGAACGGILLGGLGDRLGRARALGISILCYSVFAAAGALVTSQPQLVALRFLTGLGVGGTWPNGVALVSEWWAGTSRPVVAGVLGTAINVGILALSQLCRWQPVTPQSWRWLLEWRLAPAGLGLLALTVVPEPPLWRTSQTRRGGSSPTSPLRELFRGPLLGRTLVGTALASVALIGAWAASKWMVPWADQAGGTTQPGYKAVTQGFWAVGAALGSFLGAPLASLFGRRVTYFLISLGATGLTCGIFAWSAPLRPEFLPLVFAQGLVTTLYFGWLPLYLPELFPTRLRAGGNGVAYNVGRFATAAGVLAAGSLTAWFGGDYARAGVITGLIYAAGMIVIWWAPDTSRGTLDA